MSEQNTGGSTDIMVFRITHDSAACMDPGLALYDITLLEESLPSRSGRARRRCSSSPSRRTRSPHAALPAQTQQPR